MGLNDMKTEGYEEEEDGKVHKTSDESKAVNSSDAQHLVQ